MVYNTALTFHELYRIIIIKQFLFHVQGVRSPFLQLSNLEVGDYKFTLKVTDSSGQTDTADVQVFVKPGQPVTQVALDVVFIIQSQGFTDGVVLIVEWGL